MYTTALEQYNPAEHLVQVSTKQGPRQYYPAAWRLYELNLRFPNANFSSEIIHLDPDRDFVIVRARLYLGADYALSDKKAEAMKQGPLSQLDKLETAAKARAARDFGIGTEHALDGMEDEAQLARESLQALMAEVKTLGLASDSETWQTWKRSVLGRDVANARLSAEQLARLRDAIEAFKQEDAA